MPNLTEYIPVALDTPLNVKCVSLVVLSLSNLWSHHMEAMTPNEDRVAILLRSADFVGGASLQRLLSNVRLIVRVLFNCVAIAFAVSGKGEDVSDQPETTIIFVGIKRVKLPLD